MFNRILDKIKDYDIDGYLIKEQNNVKWLCNRNNYCLPAIIIITQSDVYIVTKSRNINAFKKIYSEYNVIFGDMKTIEKICSDLEIKRLGFESNHVSFDEYNNYKELMYKLKMIPLPDFIEDLRMIKTKEEIEKLQSATSLSDNCYNEFLNHLKVGITEIEAKNIFRSIFFKNGAEDLSFDILLSSGSNCFLPHSASTDKVIEKGDLILMDFGIVLNGYCSDTTRTVVMGNADEKQSQMYELVLKAQLNALNNIKAGISLRQADAFARDIISKEIHTGCYDYGLGHGIGVTVHEKPRIHPSSEGLLKANTVVSVEPGIYIEGWGGIRIEDLLVIGENNPGKNLTKCTKEFIEIK